MAGIFRSPEAERTMERWYERFVAVLPRPVERRRVQTTLGPTGVLVTGPEGEVPMLCFHGAMAGAPHALDQLGGLAERRRLYAVDVVGQSVASAQVRPGPEDMGRWVVEVMDGLGLERAVLFGASWGGWVALRGALQAESRCAGLALLVPAGIVVARPWTAFWQVGWQALVHAVWPTPAARDRFMATQFTTPDPMWSAFLADAMRCTRMDFSAPALLTDAELASIRVPTVVLAAERDVHFPGEPLLARCRAHLPDLREHHLMRGSKHVPAFGAPFEAELDAVLGALLDDPEVANPDGQVPPGDG